MINLKKGRAIIKIIATVFIAYGGIKIAFGLNSAWWALSYLINPTVNGITVENISFVVIMTLFLTIILPTTAIVGGFGLLKKKKWGWVCSVILSITIFVLRSVGTINFMIASYSFRNTPIPPVSDETVIISMIPIYIECAVSLFFVILLFQRFVRQSSR